MLPRNISKKSSKNSSEADNYKEFRENINTNIEPNFNKVKSANNNDSQHPMKKLSVNNMMHHNNSNIHHRPVSQY